MLSEDRRRNPATIARRLQDARRLAARDLGSVAKRAGFTLFGDAWKLRPASLSCIPMDH
jgi:hypothetical protein